MTHKHGVMDWFEVWVNPHDPTNVEMRRLTPEEAQAAYLEQMKAWFETLSIPLQFRDPPSSEWRDPFDTVPPIVDKKAQARQRSKEDLARKRRELRKGKR